MSTFAIFYNATDLTSLQNAIQGAGLTNAERQEGARYWNGGLSSWATAPFAMSPCDQANGLVDVDPPTVRRCVITVSNRTLDDFRVFLRQLAAKYPTLAQLRGLANDMEGCSGGVDPWPPA